MLAELAEVQRLIDASEAEAQSNYARRLVLLEQGRELGLSLRVMAERIGVREGALGQALHKARQRASA